MTWLSVSPRFEEFPTTSDHIFPILGLLQTIFFRWNMVEQGVGRKEGIISRSGLQLILFTSLMPMNARRLTTVLHTFQAFLLWAQLTWSPVVCVCEPGREIQDTSCTVHHVPGPHLIRTSFLPSNSVLIREVRGTITHIHSTCCQEFVSFLEGWPL